MLSAKGSTWTAESATPSPTPPAAMPPATSVRRMSRSASARTTT